MRFTAYLLPILVSIVTLIVIVSSIFIVDERERALVLRFGRVVNTVETPGLAFKVPLIDSVARYDNRILSRDIDPLEVTPLDERRLVIDAFARYRISDVKQLRLATGVSGDRAIQKAGDLLDSSLRSHTLKIVGKVTSNDILSSDRAALMLRIRNVAYDDAQKIGLELIDVRLKRTDLPTENLDATFARMRAEREREATDERARGSEAAQRVRAQADRTVVELTSEARREAEIIRGEADSERNAIFARAFGADPEFFEFYRSMKAYQRALRGENSSMVLSPDSEFFNYLKSPTGKRPEHASAIVPLSSSAVHTQEATAFTAPLETLDATVAASEAQEEVETRVNNDATVRASD